MAEEIGKVRLEITLMATCCKIYLSNKIKHLKTQSGYFSNTPGMRNMQTK